MRIRLLRDLIQYGRVYQLGKPGSETVIARKGAEYESEWRDWQTWDGTERRSMVALRPSGNIWLSEGDWEFVEEPC